MVKEKLKNLTLTALFIALVVIGSNVYIGTHDTFRFHLGNSMCLASALLLSPISGGLASGLGSMLFDIFFYQIGGPVGFLVTFITKFVMGYLTGLFFHIVLKNININPRIIVSGLVGEIAYIILYGIKTYIERRYVLGMDIKAVMLILWPKIFTSCINAVIAIVISFMLYKFLTRIKKT